MINSVKVDWIKKENKTKNTFQILWYSSIFNSTHVIDDDDDVE